MTRARDLSKFQAGANITANTAFVPDTADGATLGTSALEFSDLFLADSGTIKFGADQDVTVTHLPDNGLDLVSTNTQSIGGDVLRSTQLKLSTHSYIAGVTFDDRSSSLLNIFEGFQTRATNITNAINMNSGNYFKIRNTDDSGGGGDLVTVTSSQVLLADDMKFTTENGFFGPNGTLITDKTVLQSSNRDLNLIGYRGEVHIRSGTDINDWSGRLNVVVKDTGVELYGGAGYNNAPIKYFETDANGPKLSPGDGTAKIGIGSLSSALYNAYDTEVNIGGTDSARIKLAATNYGTGTNDGFDIYQYQNNANLLNKENGWLRFSTNNTVRGLINSVGNWGINTTAPAYKLDVNGTANFTSWVVFGSHAFFGDNDGIYMGASSDLQIYHDSNNSYIKDSGTGSLIVQTNSFELKNAAGNESQLLATENGAVTLYHNNAVKLATSSSGVTVTGTVTATSFSGDGSSLSGVGGSTSYGAVGTYGLFRSETGAVDEGNTISGSGLRPANCAGSIRGSGLSGTWRAMGKADSTGSSITGRTSVFVRIS